MLNGSMKFIEIGWMAEETPNTISMLKMLLPMMFPSIMSSSFRLAAAILVISSGIVVPRATKVNPIADWSIPKLAAIF